jgi:hypothetical protein
MDGLVDRSGVVAQVVECLPGTHEALGSFLRTSKEKRIDRGIEG